MSALGQKQTCGAQKGMSALALKADMCSALTDVRQGPRAWTAAALRLAAVSVKRVVRTYRHIKTGWCSTRRVAHLGMAATWHGYAPDDGTSNLWLCSSGSLRVSCVVRSA